MTTPPWLDEALSVALRLTLWQQFGLAFLLGSFTVATLSDLKRLSAQREFLEVWLLLLLAVLAFDAWRAHDGQASVPVLFVKWGLILGLSVLSLKGVGVLFRLAVGDVAALAGRTSGPRPSARDQERLWEQLASSDASLAGAALARTDRGRRRPTVGLRLHHPGRRCDATSAACCPGTAGEVRRRGPQYARHPAEEHRGSGHLERREEAPQAEVARSATIPYAHARNPSPAPARCPMSSRVLLAFSLAASLTATAFSAAPPALSEWWPRQDRAG